MESLSKPEVKTRSAAQFEEQSTMTGKGHVMRWYSHCVCVKEAKRDECSAQLAFSFWKLNPSLFYESECFARMNTCAPLACLEARRGIESPETGVTGNLSCHVGGRKQTLTLCKSSSCSVPSLIPLPFLLFIQSDPSLWESWTHTQGRPSILT